jgi:uncharacterized protein (DUF1800 family)
VRQLIQRLVTSNPSPGYIYRVSQAFANNGAGVRGDMRAVVRAILLDYEARSSAVAASANFGKMKEPLLRATALFRAFDAARTSAALLTSPIRKARSPRAVLRAPTVFNFYRAQFRAARCDCRGRALRAGISDPHGHDRADAAELLLRLYLCEPFGDGHRLSRPSASR